MAYSAEYHRAWRAANPEKVKRIRAKYEAAHPHYRQESLDRDPARKERHKATTAAWAKINRDRRNQSQKQSAANRRRLLDEYKLAQGCIDCGYNDHPAALHFDHRDPSTKLFTVSYKFRTTLAKVWAEIAKCDVRCANCHAIRTSNEGHASTARREDVA